jgi:hypothetical protein
MFLGGTFQMFLAGTFCYKGAVEKSCGKNKSFGK